jgi:hypothetical protein
MISACRSGAASSDASDPSAPQVKPAAAPARAEAETLEPDPEGGELPRGVSAPAPGPQDTRGGRADTTGGSARAEASDRSARVETAERAARGDVQRPETGAHPARVEAARPQATEAAHAQRATTDGLKTVAVADPPRSTAKPKPSAPKPPTAPKLPAPEVTRPPSPETAQPQPPVPQEPIAQVTPPLPPPARNASVVVPHTDHVHVDVPAGLQHWLDEDDRMKPWLGKAINVADACYAKVREDNASASGFIALSLTMHENARPSGKVSSVSGPLNSIVMCATTRLLGVKMPLFTGTEGDSYTVRIHFEP